MTSRRFLVGLAVGALLEGEPEGVEQGLALFVGGGRGDDGDVHATGLVDAVVVDPEQQVRLDQLEALVDQSCRVEGVHGAHRPGGVRVCLSRIHTFEILRAPATERPTRSGENQPGHLVACSTT